MDLSKRAMEAYLACENNLRHEITKIVAVKNIEKELEKEKAKSLIIGDLLCRARNIVVTKDYDKEKVADIVMAAYELTQFNL